MTIEVSSLRKEFSSPSGTITAVDGIDFSIDEGDFFTFVGPSGCGKTTTLRCIAGLETPTSGSIRFDGEDMTGKPAHKRNLAMMFQNIALYPHMKVKENISYPLKVRNVPKQERYENAEEAADIMQIRELLEKYPGELSGGQQQRAALARTIVHEPEAFLMDEPLSDLDAKLKVEIRKEIQRVHDRVKKPTIYVTHDQEEAMTMSDRIAVFNDGGIEQIGTPDELYQRPTNRFVANFIGNPSMNFFDGTVDRASGETVVVSVDGREVELQVVDSTAVGVGDEVTIGVRPEDVRLDRNGGDLEGEVTLIERIGKQMLATIEGPQGEVRVTLPADNSYEKGEVIRLAIEARATHLFDSGSDDVVTRGPDV
ncbi:MULTISPECIES: ABC transporter ATP-binding protein [Haloferax]|nr:MULTISPECIES: ABC transporter ATP-binding protein [Haloferax]MDS0242745.1 ABC transporter ATP-binding protein [Haloferax sp. S2CR25]MDS0445866.1 ABC transporter ATP-binding protein [Haloferax sp. S2CR25-2]